MTDKKKQGGPAYAPLPPRYYIFGNYDVWDKVQMLKYADDTHELRMRCLQANPMEWPLPHRNGLDAAPAAKFKVGDLVTKIKGSQWTGRVVGTYSTSLTPEGYAVESSTERGSVQIYPAAALELVQEAQAEQSAITSESGTPPAEQQAAPRAAPTWPSEALVWEALQAYLKHDTNMEGMRAALIVGAAPQQEAQKPVAWFEYNADLNAWFLAYHRNPKAKTRPLVFGDTTPQPAPAPLSRDQIREVFMAHGFTIKEGQTDLKQYVYDAAYALLGTKPAPLSEQDERRAFEQDFMRVLPGENLKRKFGHYEDPRTRHRWDGWKARAALAAQGGK